MSRYEVWLTDPFGVRLMLLDMFTKLEWSRSLNSPGWVALELPDGAYPFGIDHMLQVWRAPDTGPMRLEVIGFIRDVIYTTNKSGMDVIQLAGPDPLELLVRRIVKDESGSAKTNKSTYADDMCKFIVDEQLGYQSGTGRELPGDMFWTDFKFSLAPSLDMGFSSLVVLDVLQKIAKASAVAGTELYFDIVHYYDADYPFALRFETYINQPGADRTADSGGPFYAGPEWGNMSNCTLEYDYTAEVNVAYVAGAGEGVERVPKMRRDLVRVGLSPWNRREEFVDGRPDTATTVLQAKGDAALREGRPKLRFSGDMLDVPGSRYGKDWFFGDRLACDYRGQQFDGLVRSVTVTLDEKGAETVQARIEAERNGI